MIQKYFPHLIKDKFVNCRTKIRLITERIYYNINKIFPMLATFPTVPFTLTDACDYEAHVVSKKIL